MSSVPLTIDNTLPSIEGRLISLFGDLSARRNDIVKQYILDGFQDEGTSCVVTLTLSSSKLIDELSEYAPEAAMVVNDAILNERLQIVDMYSFRGIDQDEEIPGTYQLPTADDLTQLSIHLNRISKNHPKCRITIWPYSLLAIYTNHSDLINFTQTLAARLSSRDQSGLLVADRGVIKEVERISLESIVDSVVETKREEKENEVVESYRVKFIRGADQTDFKAWTKIS